MVSTAADNEEAPKHASLRYDWHKTGQTSQIIEPALNAEVQEVELSTIMLRALPIYSFEAYALASTQPWARLLGNAVPIAIFCEVPLQLRHGTLRNANDRPAIHATLLHSTKSQTKMPWQTEMRDGPENAADSTSRTGCIQQIVRCASVPSYK